MNIQAALEALGLMGKETIVYTTLLQLGEASAFEISNKSGIKRPTVYVVLDELIQKGFAIRSPKKIKQMFIARSPEEAVAAAKERFDQAQKALPLLRALVKQDQTRVNALYFDGFEGFKRGLEYRLETLEGQERVGFDAYLTKSDPRLLEYFNAYNSKLQELKISVRGVVPNHPSLKKFRTQDRAHNRTIKAVPFKDYSSKVSLYAIADLVFIADYENLQVMVLENGEVAKTVKQIFEIVWQKV